MTDTSATDPDDHSERGPTDSDREETAAADSGDQTERGPTDSDADDASDETAAADSGDRPDDASDGTTDEEAPDRYDRVARHPTPGPLNALQHWPDARHPLRVMLNYAVIVICRISPSLRLKNWLYRRLGMTVGEGVSWGLEATPDVFFPDYITVEDHAIVGYDATLLCHEFLQSEYRTGEVVVGERAMVGAGAVVLPGVHVGEGAQVAANSLVVEDVPPDTTVAGVPAEPVEE